MIKGEVLSVTDDGILVICPYTATFGMSKPKPDEVVFVKGNFNFVDGDKVNLTAGEIGTYKYISAGGAAKTVRAFVAGR